MPLRNRPEGYGSVTRTLHWATVLALLVQFVVGYAMDWDGGSGGGRGRGRGRGEGSGRGRGRGGDDDASWGVPDLGDEPLVTVHVALGLTIIVLALARGAWRRLDSLPAWADQLTDRDRRLATWTERALLWLLLLVPTTGIALLVSGDDDLLWLHVAAHVAFFAALAAHLGLVARRRLLPRMLGGAPDRRQEAAHG